MSTNTVDPYNLTDEQKARLRENNRKWKIQAGPPVITIFVRHSADCKYRGDEFEKRCRCPKHLRWSHERKQHRLSAHTRSWSVAENKKREIEDQLAGREPRKTETANTLKESIDVFIKDKRVQGVTDKVLGKYTRELERLRAFCDRKAAYTVKALTRELLTEFCSTWEDIYPSTLTRAKVRERLRSFLRYCYEAQWLERIQQVPRIIVDEPETQPLTTDEYKRLLDSIYAVVQDPKTCARVHALFQLMRWSGLAIRDALTLEKSELVFNSDKSVYRVVKQRAKMKRKGTGHVSVPIPTDVAEELLAVLNGNPRYFFWSGNGEAESITKGWAKYYIVPCFAQAKIVCEGHMMSHRLRDTFAVDLLVSGVPLEEVSKLLGHESIKTTEKHYAKWIQDRQDRLDSLVMATWKKRR